MSNHDLPEEEDAPPTFEDFKRLTKEERHALVEESRAAMGSVIARPEAAASERYNAIASERLKKAEDSLRDAERILENPPALPEVDGAKLAEAAAETVRILEGDLLAYDDAQWQEAKAQIVRFARKMRNAENDLSAYRAEAMGAVLKCRTSGGVESDIKYQASLAFEKDLLEAGVDWRLLSKDRSTPWLDAAFAKEYLAASRNFEETPLDAENSKKLADLKRTLEALAPRAEGIAQGADLPPATAEALQRARALEMELTLSLTRNPLVTDPYEATARQKGEAYLTEKGEKSRRDREAFAERKQGLEKAFLGKLRHGREIDDLARQIAVADEDIARTERIAAKLADEKRRKERVSEALAALRGVRM